MNYYVTHCDKTYIKYAERLFETLSLFSSNKIIFYTVDFDYICKYKNVIVKKITTDNRKSQIKSSVENNDLCKVHHVFLKPLICIYFSLHISSFFFFAFFRRFYISLFFRLRLFLLS